MDWSACAHDMLPPRSCSPARENYYHPWERFTGRELHPHCQYEKRCMSYQPWGWATGFYELSGADVAMVEKYGAWGGAGRWFMWWEDLFRMIDTERGE